MRPGSQNLLTEATSLRLKGIAAGSEMRVSSSCANRVGFIVGGVQRKNAGPVVDTRAGVGATRIGIQQAAVTNPSGCADQQLNGDVAQGVQGCHAAIQAESCFANVTRSATSR